jgi:hypothetical protein
MKPIRAGTPPPLLVMIIASCPCYVGDDSAAVGVVSGVVVGVSLLSARLVSTSAVVIFEVVLATRLQHVIF